MEEDNPPPFTSSFGVGTSGAGPSFQGTSNMSNDEVLARMMSRMDIFDTRLNGMETMIADRFQSIEIMYGSLILGWIHCRASFRLLSSFYSRIHLHHRSLDGF
ncbi:hypothetical protein JCGZ_14869 [Jatropha curcas]|uniref:Uncharacterized protein n=1 Tax=Jatropha curcas TaxID=180498 RepID=A0A067KK43_JATCU|nr:hypothetical protein JCGZ_14869 [Jatropha curcas]